MAKTLQNFIDAVTGHLGNRSGGMIGTQSMADSITSSVNNGISKIAKKYRLPVLDRVLYIPVTAGTVSYDIPLLDLNNNPIRVRNFLNFVYVNDSGDGYPLTKLSPNRFDTVFPPRSSTNSGTPVYYSIFANTIRLYPTPDVSGSLNIKATIWPESISNLADVSPLGQEWDDAIEEYATSECFAKLQQSLDAKLWMGVYEKTLRETQYAFSEEPDHVPSLPSASAEFVAGEPVNNPFVNRWN